MGKPGERRPSWFRRDPARRPRPSPAGRGRGGLASGLPPLQVGVGADDFAARPGGQGPPGRRVDGILDELDRAVEERHVHPAGVVRAGADDRVDGVLALPLVEAGLLVRCLDVAVATPLAAIVVEIFLALAVVGRVGPGRIPRGRGLARGSQGRQGRRGRAGEGKARDVDLVLPVAGRLVHSLDPLAEDRRVRGAVDDRGDRHGPSVGDLAHEVGGAVDLTSVQVVDGADVVPIRGVADLLGDAVERRGPARDVGVGRAEVGIDLHGPDRPVDRVGARIELIQGIEGRLLLHEGEDPGLHREVVVGRRGRVRADRGGRECPVDVVVVHHRQPQLLQVVDALRASGGLARRLDGGQEQRDQDGDDGDHDQQLDQREAALTHFHVSSLQR